MKKSLRAFFLTGNHQQIVDTPASKLKYSNRTARQNEIRRGLEGQSWVDAGVELIKCIDDCNGIGKINTHEGITTLSCSKQKRKFHAAQSEGVLH